MKKIKLLLFIITIICFLSIFNSVNAVEELPDNGATISSSQIIQTKTGTGPFDENDDPGNDSSEDNNVVRSFDQVTWTVENTMVINNGDSAGYTGGKIYFEAILPDVFNSETAKWDLESMAWIENSNLSDDGLTLTGYYQMGTENITVPGKQTLVFVAKILGAENETEFQPEIKLWLNGNSEADYKTVISEKITVSAAPSYNIKFVRNTNLNKRVLDLDYNGQSIDGRVYGYAFILQLYNNDVSKGLKGVEYPKGDITFDIDLKFERTALGSTQREDITQECTPILWNYKVNYGSEVLENRSMNFGSSNNNARWVAPVGANNSDRKKTVYNSGDIKMEQNGSKLSVTVSNYKFDGIFPQYNNEYTSQSSIAYKDNVGCFSVGYFQIIIPDNDASMQESSNYYLSLNDNNFNATSISNQSIKTQAVTTDDSLTLTHVRYSPGSFTHYIYLYNTSNSMLHTQWNMGDSIVSLGQKFKARSFVEIEPNNDPDDYIRTVDRFFKFDAEAYELTSYTNEKMFNIVGMNNMTWKYWFVTKKDGTNWSSQTDMNNGNIEDMVLYESLDDIPEGDLCIGVYFESQGGYIPTPRNDSTYYFEICLQVKNTAQIGQTYAMTQTSRYWREELDRGIYSQTILDSYDTYPETAYTGKNMNYIKTEYDENGSIVPGTHSGAHIYGQTALVVGAQQGISQKPIDENGNEKVNYDLGRNENVVTFKITPTLTSYGSIQANIKDVAITITDTLPAGLTYVPNSSNYGEPQLTKNADGTTTLVWQITGCNVDEKIDDLVFNASIYEETPNGTQYENKAVISAEQDKIGNTSITKRTSTSTIQIVNLSSHRLYKSVNTPVIEKNGEIHYTISYKNNTDEIISDFQLLDILPYNGDSRGTEYTGEYTLDRLVITQENENGETISNDNLEILYTADETVRETVTSKDDNLGDGWNKALSEIIKQKVTAFAIKGEIGAQGSVTIDIYLKTENNTGLDKYVNSATAQVYEETEEMTTSSVISQVVKRQIEGVAWEDSNGNGVIDEGEQLFANVEVTLTNDQGEQVTDVNGNIVSSVKTDDKGYYSFENLPKGDYYVKVSVPSNKYTLTEKEVGTNNAINSKFNVEERETDEITRLNSIDLPELTVSNVNAGFVKKETKVIVNYKEIGTDKILSDEVTINGRIDDEYSTENKLDEINANNDNKYEYVRVEGTTEGQMTEDTIYVTYWYQKKAANVKVLHVLEGTDVSSPESVTDVLYPTEELTGRVDDDYSTQNRLSEINENSQIEYELVEDNVANKTGQMTVDTIYVVYEYRTIPATIKIEHKDIDTDEELMDTVTENGLVGESYTTENKLDEINEKYDNKYELVSEPGNKDGEYKREEQTITYYYQKKMGEVEVNYLEVGTEKVLASQEILKDKVDKEYTTVNKLDEINAANEDKYEFVKTTGDAIEGVYKVEKQVVNYYYQKKAANVKVLHVLEGTDVSNPESVTDVLYPTEELTGRVDDSYSTQNRLSEINSHSQIEYELVEDNVANKTG